MSIELNAKTRSDLGKGASRRLRREGEVPAIIYGGTEPQSVVLSHNELLKAQEKSGFFASVINLNVDGKAQNVVIKDLQRHPAKPLIQHVDFQRADASTELTLEVPLVYINGEISPAVKTQGGSIQVVAKTLRVRCVPSKLPASITVDLKSVNAGQILHISDVQLPEGVVSADLQSGADRNHPIALINSGRAKG
jgi:large subunit ribosomal protein L25